MLSSYPICIEWMPYNKNTLNIEENKAEKGNFAIVGSFLNEIEIWDIDEKDPVEPYEIWKGSKKFGNLEGHLDSVTSLQINPFRPNYLISGSSDNYCKIWDLNENKVLLSSTFKNKEVHNIKWSPFNEQLYFVTYSDGSMFLVDGRENKQVCNINLKVDIENICFNYSNNNNLFVALEDGYIKELNYGDNFKEINSIKGHDKNVSSISSHPNLKNHFITSSLDGKMKLWNNNFELKATQITKAKLFNGNINIDNPYIYCCGSNINELIIWNFSDKIIEKNDKENEMILEN